MTSIKAKIYNIILILHEKLDEYEYEKHNPTNMYKLQTLPTSTGSFFSIRLIVYGSPEAPPPPSVSVEGD